MSKENLEQFMNQVADSEELQTRIGEEIDAESLIALGAECGCEFTAEELQESAELSEEELDAVAGGGWARNVMRENRLKVYGRTVDEGAYGVSGSDAAKLQVNTLRVKFSTGNWALGIYCYGSQCGVP